MSRQSRLYNHRNANKAEGKDKPFFTKKTKADEVQRSTMPDKEKKEPIVQKMELPEKKKEEGPPPVQKMGSEHEKEKSK